MFTAQNHPKTLDINRLGVFTVSRHKALQDKNSSINIFVIQENEENARTIADCLHEIERHVRIAKQMLERDRLQKE